LRFGDDAEHVGRPALDEGHEGAMAEWAVGAAEGEVVAGGELSVSGGWDALIGNRLTGMWECRC
jgi:hypothetical protein